MHPWLLEDIGKGRLDARYAYAERHRLAAHIKRESTHTKRAPIALVVKIAAATALRLWNGRKEQSNAVPAGMLHVSEPTPVPPTPTPVSPTPAPVPEMR